MWRGLCATLLVQLCVLSAVSGGAEQRVRLSDSYLPAALQVIAHLVDQMSYESEPPAPAKPASTTPQPARPPHTTSASYGPGQGGSGGGWSIALGVGSTTQESHISPVETTTPFHKPGIFQSERPPKPSERIRRPTYQLLPVQNHQFSLLEPDVHRGANGLLSPETEGELKPIVEEGPAAETLLPPARYEPVDPLPRAADPSPLTLEEDELNENNLQHVSPDIRDILRLAHDPDDERALDVDIDGLNKASQTASKQKQKLSQSNLRLLLLHDLLSREAKRLKLHEFGGFSEGVARAVGGAGREGGARAQLRLVLARMVERRDSEHDYANNRSKEMVAELGKDDSLLSAELRSLQPLVYQH